MNENLFRFTLDFVFQSVAQLYDFFNEHLLLFIRTNERTNDDFLSSYIAVHRLFSFGTNTAVYDRLWIGDWIFWFIERVFFFPFNKSPQFDSFRINIHQKLILRQKKKYTHFRLNYKTNKINHRINFKVLYYVNG